MEPANQQQAHSDTSEKIREEKTFLYIIQRNTVKNDASK